VANQPLALTQRAMLASLKAMHDSIGLELNKLARVLSTARAVRLGSDCSFFTLWLSHFGCGLGADCDTSWSLEGTELRCICTEAAQCSHCWSDEVYQLYSEVEEGGGGVQQFFLTLL